MTPPNDDVAKDPAHRQGTRGRTASWGWHRANIYGPIGYADTAVLVVRGADEIVLPFRVISDRGTGLKPMDGRALDELFARIIRAGVVTRRRAASE
jgi:hypothetical protein